MTALVRGTGGVPGVVKASLLTAVTVMKDGTNYLMCPFFGKCDGVLVIDVPQAKVAFVPNSERTADALCSAIIESNVARLICGFVPETECNRLRAAGIDVRLGSCASDVEDLVTEFEKLPQA